MMKFYALFSLVLIIACASNQSKEIDKVSDSLSEKTVMTSTIELPKTSNMDMTIDLLMGKFEPKSNEDFVVIDDLYSDQPDRLMRLEAYESFVQMHMAAKSDGIDLIIKSATRNFGYQKGIWERKWTGQTTLSNGINLGKSKMNDLEKSKMILLYSSMPGTSRHHWGTDIDLNSFNNSYFEDGEGLKVFNWLKEHAHEFGFCRPYTKKDSERPEGYEEEKWHWSYMPLSNKYLSFAKTNMNDNLIKGFRGSETAPALEIVKNYIFGINKTCKSWH